MSHHRGQTTKLTNTISPPPPTPLTKEEEGFKIQIKSSKIQQLLKHLLCRHGRDTYVQLFTNGWKAGSFASTTWQPDKQKRSHSQLRTVESSYMKRWPHALYTDWLRHVHKTQFHTYINRQPPQALGFKAHQLVVVINRVCLTHPNTPKPGRWLW